jgi:competence protein ComEC
MDGGKPAQRDTSLQDRHGDAAVAINPNETSHSVAGLTILAAALAAGIAVGWRQNHTTHLMSPSVAIASSAGLLCIALLARVLRFSRIAMMALSLSTAALGASWAALDQHFACPNDLTSLINQRTTLLRVQGVALAAPVMKCRTSGALARFDYRQPATYFPMRIDSLVSRDGSVTKIQGKVLVRVDESVPPFRAGDSIQTIGFLTRPNAPHNPGEFDYYEYAKSLGQAGFLTVAGRELLRVMPASRDLLGGWVAAVLDWRDQLRRRASAWLLADLPHSGSQRSGSLRPRDALLANLLLGLRDEQVDGQGHVAEIDDSFRRVGLAHVLAISGFHLAVLAGFLLLSARVLTGYQRWHGWLIIAAVLAYLTMIEIRMPVLRAAIMTIAASLGLVVHRRLRASGLVSLSAIALLLWRPDQLFNAGFQLTYGVVLALLHLSAPLQRRWFSEARGRQGAAHQFRISDMVRQSVQATIASSVVAWAVATPIAAYHFGVVSPLAVGLSVIAVPLASVILALGFTKMALSATLGSAALILGIPLSISADVLVGIVSAVDGLPISLIHVPFPSTWWSLAAIAWVTWCILGDCRLKSWRGAAKWFAMAALVCWLCWPQITRVNHPRLRVDMLSVGDGSCYVIRSGDHAAVFDAGSSTDLNIAKRSLIPAMRRLGVQAIDFIAISHADLDHYSGVLDLADEFKIQQVLLTPQFMDEARHDQLGPAAWMVQGLTERRVLIRTAASGTQLRLGELQLTWLHPASDKAYEKANDGSMVLRIEWSRPGNNGPQARVLLCGDIQRQAMETLLKDSESIRADVMELPHHGSFHDLAVSFIHAAAPDIVLQSTGWSRWQSDKWAAALAAKQRLVTARDGACAVQLNDDGTWSVRRFLQRQP